MPKESIRVVARFRPINKREKEEWKVQGETTFKGQDMVPVEVIGGDVIKIQNSKSKNARPYRFTFDEVMWWSTPQNDAFKKIAEPVCMNALEGFNGTVFAYGQTGSGKTFSMLGPEVQETFNPTLSGLIPRAANFFFQAIENFKTIESGSLEVSFLECYRGAVRDLNPIPGIEYPDLKIRQTKKGATYVEHLNQVKVSSLAHVLKLIAIANGNRTMAYTKMNATSSRSHFIMTYYLTLFQTPQAGGTKLISKVAFVDLAGSEKVKKTGASGDRLKEAQSINSGLLTLSRVIEALSKGKKSGAVPFRDSILTWILKDSLAGNTKTTLLIALSPHLFNRDETVTTCRFGARCKAIKMKVYANAELTPAQMKAMIKKLREENEMLREQLELAEKGGKKKKKKKGGDDDFEENGGMSTENLQLLEEYKNRNEEHLDRIRKLEEELEEAKDDASGGVQLSEGDQRKLEEYDNLKTERDNLRDEVEGQEMNQRNLAIMNALLAEKLDQRDSDESLNEQNIVDLARGNLEHLKKHKKTLLQQLQELNFNDSEAQEIYFSVFEDIMEVAREQEDREKERLDLEAGREVLISNLEQRDLEIAKLQQTVEQYENTGIDPTRTQTSMVQMSGDMDDFKYGGAGVTVPIGFNVNLADQEEYLQKLAEKENEVWREREERAWKAFLNQVAKEEGFKKGSEFLRFRRKEAEQMVNDGELEEMPEDDELLEDIREEFYKLYDPATGQLRDPNAVKEEEVPPVEYMDEISDEDGVDDPFEWDEEEVAEWLRDQGLKKYAKSFRKERIDGRVLLIDLNKTNLKRDLGVKSVHLNKLMTAITELRFRSDGYDIWKLENGIEEEAAGPMMQKMNTIDPRAMNANKGLGRRTDDDYDMGHYDMVDGGDEEDFVLTEEEKGFGENFWQIDELFDILDIRKTGELDRAAFKHGLHALRVEMTDKEMSDTFDKIAEDNADGNTDVLTYKAFIKYLQYVDMLGPQSQKYARDILDTIPKVAGNRRQYVTRAAMVIKYAQKYNNSKREINNYLQNKGLQRAEILAAWKQYRFNPKAIRDIDFKSMIGKKGKLVDMAIRDPEHVSPFDDFTLYKLLKRAGFKGFGSKEFNDLDFLRAAGDGARIWSIKGWWAPKSEFFNGLQVTYICANKEKLIAGKNMVRQGDYIEDEMRFNPKEVLTAITVYFAHFVCGIRFYTDKREKLIGSDWARTSTTLVAPAGTCIMAFYGSIGRLFETIGCYVVVNDQSKGQRNAHHGRSGTKQLSTNEKQKKQHVKTMTMTSQNEGDGGTTHSRRKSKRKNKYDD